MISSRDINKFAVPLILTNIGQIIIGQFALHFAVANSSVALSAIAIIQNFLFAFAGLLGAFSLAFNIKSSKAYTLKKYDRFYDLLRSSFIIDVLIGLGFAFSIIVYGETLLSQFYGFQGQLLKLSTNYLFMMAPYIGLTLLNFSLTNLLRVQKKTKPIMWIGLISSLLDVGLNYLLVPRLGIRGAALSTIISLCFITFSYSLMVFPMIVKALTTKATTILELVKLGLPLVGQEILESVLFIIVFDAFMTRLSLDMLAIYAVISQLLSIVRIPSFVYATTMSVYLPEAEKTGSSDTFMKTIFKNAYCVSAIIACPVIVASNQLAHFLSDEITTNIISITLFTFLAMGISPIYESSKMRLQSSDKETFVLRISILVNLVFVFLMILLQLLNQQTYFTLYINFGLSLTVLAIIFLRQAQHKDLYSP